MRKTTSATQTQQNTEIKLGPANKNKKLKIFAIGLCTERRPIP